VPYLQTLSGAFASNAPFFLCFACLRSPDIARKDTADFEKDILEVWRNSQQAAGFLVAVLTLPTSTLATVLRFVATLKAKRAIGVLPSMLSRIARAEWTTTAVAKGLHPAVAALIEAMDGPHKPHFPTLRRT
ncbi:MAG: hypothetical protein Q9165_008597, partial [Trypethelium subeluteriae]